MAEDIKDRITAALAKSIQSSSPFETLKQVGQAAAKAASSNVTFGDVMSAQEAQRLQASQALMTFLNKEREMELKEAAGQREERRLGFEEDRLGMEQERLGMDRDRLGLEGRRVDIQAGQLDLQRQEGERADARLGLDIQGQQLDRDRLALDRITQAAKIGNEQARIVSDTIKNLVPEDHRAVYAGELERLPYDVHSGNIAAAIGSVRQKLEAEGRLPTAQADFNEEATLRDDFTGLSKEFVKSRDAFDRIQASAEDPSAAGDMAMIFNYMKLLDPGSTVREGEFATAANAAGVPERVRNVFNRVVSGERLGDDQRADFLDRSERLYSRAAKRHLDLETGFRGISERRGHDPRNTVPDLMGGLRYRGMSNAELEEAINNATPGELDALEAEVRRRTGGP